MDINNMQYWQERYLENSTGWDVGSISTPLKEYINQLSGKDIKILIPGAGNAHEAEYLHKQGFSNVHVIDWAPKAIENLQSRLPDFPKEHLYVQDFFTLEEKFDLILEQTFFCAITPNLRPSYVEQMNNILVEKGKLVGLLFQFPLKPDGPPFGGSKDEYLNLFQDKFNIKTLETAYNSITPRSGNELFMILQKK